MSFDLVRQSNRWNDESQSLWSRAMSFDSVKRAESLDVDLSQSLWNRAMSFDNGKWVVTDGDTFQSLWNRAMSFDVQETAKSTGFQSVFQSLWNRAMSFDAVFTDVKETAKSVSIPLEQGNVFRHRYVVARKYKI